MHLGYNIHDITYMHLGYNIHASKRTKQFICISFSILAWEPSAAQCPVYHRLPALGRKL